MPDDAKCACPRTDARDCIIARTPALFFSEDDSICERCECACHDQDESEDPT